MGIWKGGLLVSLALPLVLLLVSKICLVALLLVLALVGSGSMWGWWYPRYLWPWYLYPWPPVPTPEQELFLLENYKKALEAELKMIEERINSLKGQLGRQ
jgi:hypothetical protein